ACRGGPRRDHNILRYKGCPEDGAPTRLSPSDRRTSPMAMAPEQMGIGIRRHFTEPGTHPYDTLEWERRDARIPNYKDGTDAFFQPGVEFPVAWSQNAANIVAQTYFR